jgi:hypothetical protein
MVKVRKAIIDVIIFTQQHRIEGKAHLSSGGRFTDFMNAPTRLGFIPITDAKIYSLATDKLLYSIDLLNINKNLVVLAFPQASEQPGQAE